MKLLKVLLAALLSVSAAYAANEITAQVSLKATKGYLDMTRGVNAQWTLTQTPATYSAGVQLISTNPVQITVGDVTTNGWSWFRNNSTNNTMNLGTSPDSGTNVAPLIKLKPGWYALVPLSTSTVWAVCPTVATNETSSALEKLILND